VKKRRPTYVKKEIPRHARRWVALFDDSEEGLLGLERCFELSSDGDHIFIIRALAWKATLTDIKANQQQLNKIQESLIQRSKPKHLNVESTVLVASAAKRKLCNKITLYEADIVVVGSKGQGRTPGAALGSIAKHVVDKASCSVMVIHKKRPKGEQLEDIKAEGAK